VNRKLLTTILLITLCGAGTYSWLATPQQRRVSDAIVSKPDPDRSHQQVLQKHVDNLDFSDGETSSYHKPRKNLFAALYQPPVVVKRSPPPTPISIMPKPLNKPAVIVSVEPQTSKPAPIQPLTVLGYLNKATKFTVFLSSAKGDIFLVKTGDTFANNLVVDRINKQEISISNQHTKQRVTLKIGETKSQRMPQSAYKSDRPDFIAPQPEEQAKKTPTQSPDKKIKRWDR